MLTEESLGKIYEDSDWDKWKIRSITFIDGKKWFVGTNTEEAYVAGLFDSEGCQMNCPNLLIDKAENL